MSLRLSLAAWRDLRRRYGQVFRHSWGMRKEWDSKRYEAAETEFLPAALALQQRPVSPAPRAAMWLLILFCVVALLWSTFGRVDIVATAQGKIIPTEGTQVVQPIGTAVIKAIHVREGSLVKEGDLLVELDGTSTTAERQRIQNDMQAQQLQAGLAESLLHALDTGRAPRVSLFDADSLERASAQRLADGEHAALQNKMAGIDAQLRQRQAELATTMAQVRKLERVVPIARQRAGSLKELADAQYVARNTYLDRERERIEQESELAVQRGRLLEIEAAIAQARQQRATLMAESRYANLTRGNEARQKLALLEQDLVKAKQSEQLTRLVAPVSGTVQQLTVRTLGGIVTSAQSLMLVVPDRDMLEVEVFLENKDVGFVLAGQQVELKVETFPYTKYGVIPGTVSSISNDAIEDEKRGLIYAVRIAMARSFMVVNGQTIRLAPGMAVTAEVKTGRRRVIEFFLDPLMRHTAESLRER